VIRRTRPTDAALAALLAAAGCGEPDAAPSGPEAGFIEIEPVDYQIHGDATAVHLTSSRARLFYDFHPADENPGQRPLIVLYSGGPGASTAILLGGNTAPLTLDPERTEDGGPAPNDASWTAFANLLYVDARGTGFSYGIAPGLSDDTTHAMEFTVRNFNPFLDAADVVRVILRFLDAHPALRSSRVVLAGESYGGVRTEVALHLLHHPERYETTASLYADPSLTSEIRGHFARAGTAAEDQFDRAILLQPRLFTPNQQAAAGAAFEEPGSLLHAVADQTGMPYVPCSQLGAGCSPFTNAVQYLASVDRDLYDVRKPAGAELARYAGIGNHFESEAVLSQILGVRAADIEDLLPPARVDAYRLSAPAELDEALAQPHGPFPALPAYDRYFETELFDLLGAPFAGTAAQTLGIERQHARYGLYFLEDLLDVRMFVTNAAFDADIFTPSLPDAIAMYTDQVKSVHKAEGAVTVDLKPGAFGAPAEGASRSFTFVTYDASGHSVTLDQPEKLSADLRNWLSATK
jgi:pimeloyl-ACP methyl ester carboxylesterase